MVNPYMQIRIIFNSLIRTRYLNIQVSNLLRKKLYIEKIMPNQTVVFNNNRSLKNQVIFGSENKVIHSFRIHGNEKYAAELLELIGSVALVAVEKKVRIQYVIEDVRIIKSVKERLNAKGELEPVGTEYYCVVAKPLTTLCAHAVDYRKHIKTLLDDKGLTAVDVKGLQAGGASINSFAISVAWVII